MQCADADAIFRANPEIRSIVVHGPSGIRLVSRAALHDALSGPNGYGYALYGKRPLSSLPCRVPVVATADTPCEWVTQRLLAAGQGDDDDVLVDFGNGWGTVAGSTLLNHLWTLSRGRARLLDDERRRLHALVDHSSDYTLIVDRHGALIWANVVGAAAFPYGNVLDGVEADDMSRAWDLLTAASSTPGEITEGEFRFRFADGDHRWYLASFHNLISDPAVGGLVVSMRDVENERRLRDDLQIGATTDQLTGLANRAAVVADFDARVARGEHPTLLWLDLDGFTEINQRFGTPTGDAVLQDLSRRLRAASTLDDTVARIGADQFAILASDIVDEVGFGTHIQNQLLAPFEVEGNSLRMTASIGVASMNAEATTAPELADQAELALKAAKSTGRNGVVAFDATLAAEVRRRDALRGRLRVALSTGAFSLVFQPQMALGSSQPLRGFEALIRWPDAARGSIPPDEFIPLAEVSGDIVDIGRWVLTGALDQLAEWHRFGAELMIAVNTSARELAEADFADFVRRELERVRIAPHFLEIEVTETALATDDVAVHETLDQLSELGVGIAVDDYGSGKASLAYLRRYPISTIKVDRELVSMLEQDRTTASALLRSITDVAGALGLRSVVEGLETAEQTAYARDLGFDLGQGWHCGMPMSPLRASKLVAVARRDDSAPRTDADDSGLASFEATLEAFDEINAYSGPTGANEDPAAADDETYGIPVGAWTGGEAGSFD